MKLLDLFCGAGGAGEGYRQAGFEVTGVDIADQQHYKAGTFIKADALTYLREHGSEYDVIHASPPCKKFTSVAQIRSDAAEYIESHENWIEPIRLELLKLGKPYIIENVVGAKKHLVKPFTLCGTMFDLKVIRHRLFETNVKIKLFRHCKHNGTVANGDYCGVYGNGSAMWRDKARTERRQDDRSVKAWREAMGIDWMLKKEITQAIPPAYTKWIGKQILKELENGKIVSTTSGLCKAG